VEQRTREIGIRVALGATQTNIVALILRYGMGWVAGGMAIGIGIAVASGRALSAMLFGITAADPLTLGVVIVLLAAVATVASLLPARRAMKVDPTVALRHE
jgi:putative ABC transport system permease protein